MSPLLRLPPRLSLFLVFALGPLAARGLADNQASDLAQALTRLSTHLVKQADRPDNSARVDLLRYADQLGTWQRDGQYDELERAFIRIRALLPEDDTKAEALLAKAENGVRRTRDQELAREDAAYRELETEFVAKFNARAPAADFDALLVRLNLPGPRRPANPREATRSDGLRIFVTHWQDYLLHSAAGNSDRALSALDVMVQQSARLPIIPRSQLLALRLSTGKLPRTEGGGGGDQVFSDLQLKLGTVLGTATKASDLDAIVAETRTAAKAAPSHNLLNTLSRHAQRWQDYYAAIEAGNASAAANARNQILSDDIAISAVPRSRILAMQNLDRSNSQLVEPLASPAELTLDNLGLFRQQVAFRRNFGLPSDFDLAPLVRATDALWVQVEHLRKNRPEAVFESAKNSIMQPGAMDLGPYAEALAGLQRELTRSALIMYLQPPDDLPPPENATLATYASHLIQQGIARQDWPLVHRIGAAAARQKAGHVYSDADLRGIGSFLDGVQNERAGHWSRAVTFYYRALQAGSPLLPAEEVGQRLARIKSEHPEEFAQAQTP